MSDKPDRDLLAALASVVDKISASDEGMRWWPGIDVAAIAYSRWRSFARRNNGKTPTREQRVNDLIKGLRAHIEPDIPYTH